MATSVSHDLSPLGISWVALQPREPFVLLQECTPCLHAGKLSVCWDKRRGNGRHPAVCVGTGKAEAALLKSVLSQVRAWSGGKHPLGYSSAALQTTQLSWIQCRRGLHIFCKFHFSYYVCCLLITCSWLKIEAFKKLLPS